MVTAADGNTYSLPNAGPDPEILFYNPSTLILKCSRASHPYATDIFERFIQHILDQVANDSLSEESALETGYF